MKAMDLQLRLFRAQCAACTCLTKTPEVEYHKDDCRYRVLVEAQRRIDLLEAALRYYASGHHVLLSDASAWDSVSGEPPNFLCDEAGTATIEDGSIAKGFLLGQLDWKGEEAPDLLPEERASLEARGEPNG